MKIISKEEIDDALKFIIGNSYVYFCLTKRENDMFMSSLVNYKPNEKLLSKIKKAREDNKNNTNYNELVTYYQKKQIIANIKRKKEADDKFQSKLDNKLIWMGRS